jgi:hypothetical protein
MFHEEFHEVFHEVLHEVFHEGFHQAKIKPLKARAHAGPSPPALGGHQKAYDEEKNAMPSNQKVIMKLTCIMAFSLSLSLSLALSPLPFGRPAGPARPAGSAGPGRPGWASAKISSFGETLKTTAIFVLPSSKRSSSPKYS